MYFTVCFLGLYFTITCFLIFIKVKISSILETFFAICVASIIFTFISSVKAWQMEKLSLSNFKGVFITIFYFFYGWFYLSYLSCSTINLHLAVNLYFTVFLTYSSKIIKLAVATAGIFDCLFYLWILSLCFCSKDLNSFQSKQAYASQNLATLQLVIPLMYYRLQN